MQLFTVDAFVERQQLAKQLYGMFIAFFKVAADEALRLDNDIFYELMLFLRRHCLSQLFHLFNNVSSVRLSVRTKHLEILPGLLCAFSFEYINIEVGEGGNAEIKMSHWDWGGEGRYVPSRARA